MGPRRIVWCLERYHDIKISGAGVSRIHQVRTDNRHEFQAKFHWHVEDQGIRLAYIKPHSPRFNGKVERSLRTDEEEFYQLLTYKDDVDLEEKPAH